MSHRHAMATGATTPTACGVVTHFPKPPNRNAAASDLRIRSRIGVCVTMDRPVNAGPGEVAERLNAPVLKTGVASGSPWVRIPPSPFTHRPARFLPVAPARMIVRTGGLASRISVSMGGDERMGTTRIGFLTWSDHQGPGDWSGSPWSIRSALDRAGYEMVTIECGPYNPVGHGRKIGLRIADRFPRIGSIARSVKRTLSEGSDRVRRRSIDAATIADANIAQLRPDLVVGVKMSLVMGCMRSSLPFVYVSDATASEYVKGYATGKWQNTRWQRSIIEAESRTIQRADRTILYFDQLVDSAIRDHGGDPARISVSHPGANITAGPESNSPERRPGREDLQVLFVASDPVRKRLTLAADAVDGLRDRGWAATLNYIGPPHPAAERSSIRSVGRLRLEDPEDRKKHLAELDRNHVNLLPTQADMCPLSVAEASSCGIPSVVSRLGGLPLSVIEGKTGRLLDVDAELDDWVDALEWTVADPERYRRLSVAAQEYARTNLTWDAWAERASKVIDELREDA